MPRVTHPQRTHQQAQQPTLLHRAINCSHHSFNTPHYRIMKYSVLSLLLALHSVSAFVAPSTTTILKTTTLLWSTDDDNEKKDDSLWESAPTENKKEMSKSLPFAPRPKLLDGTLAGDVGFDPFNFAGADKASLLYMREAELKHSRLAMLAVVGWPLAELWDKPLAEAIGLPTKLTTAGASPSFLNGGLDAIDVAYWVGVVAMAGVVEIENSKAKEEKGKDYLPGDCNFDPLGLFPADKEGQMAMMTREIKHGRLAMMALLGFVVQEALYRTPVVQETPMFFTPQFF